VKPDPAEFAPLAWFPWDVRPDSRPLEEDECATALYLSNGHIADAAKLLKADAKLMKRAIGRSAKLRHLLVRLGSTGE
jgi:hypothetical protein